MSVPELDPAAPPPSAAAEPEDPAVPPLLGPVAGSWPVPGISGLPVAQAEAKPSAAKPIPTVHARIAPTG